METDGEEIKKHHIHVGFSTEKQRPTKKNVHTSRCLTSKTDKHTRGGGAKIHGDASQQKKTFTYMEVLLGGDEKPRQYILCTSFCVHEQIAGGCARVCVCVRACEVMWGE